MDVRFSQEEFYKLKNHLVHYTCALKNMETRVNILIEDFNLHQDNPIEHVKARLKSPESIAAKLKRRGFAITADSAIKNLTDIAGIRCICSFSPDIITMADILRRQEDMTILYERDYINSPKPSGYRSFHLGVELPIYLAHETLRIPVEVQLRTQAMDFWATLEHKARYKYDNEVPESVTAELVECSNEIDQLDERMYEIHRQMKML